MTGGRRTASTGGKSGFLLLIALVSDDRDACGECRKAVHVISVTMGENHSGRLRRDLGDIRQQFLAAVERSFGIHNDHAFIADDDAAVSAAAFNPVHVGLLTGEWQRCGRSLRERHRSEGVQSQQRRKSERKIFFEETWCSILLQKLYHDCGATWTPKERGDS